MPISLRAIENSVLATVPKAEYSALFENLESIHLPFQEIIYYAGQTIDYVYFPLQSVISLAHTAPGQSASEVALIGREGVVGLPVFLGYDRMDSQAMILVAGSLLRIEKSIFQAEVQRPGSLRDNFLAYTQGRLNQLSQNIVCKSHHTVQQQFARWLLTIHDQVEGQQLLLTHPFIAQQFGVRRASITEAAIKLQNAGYIAYQRGKISVLDPKGLESMACSCYGTVKSFFATDSLDGDG